MDTPAIAAECLLRGLRRGDDLEEKKKTFLLEEPREDTYSIHCSFLHFSESLLDMNVLVVVALRLLPPRNIYDSATKSVLNH